MMDKSFMIWIILSGLTLSLCTSCKEAKGKDVLYLPIDSFNDGDLAFRRGAGLLSHAVMIADQKGVYSHVGIMIQLNGKWQVIHAVPDEPDFKGDVDRVKIEPLDRFFASDKAVRGAVMKFKGNPSIAKQAAKVALHIAGQKILFDHHYNLNDTTEMYCTELVNYAYQKAGINLSEGRISQLNVPTFKGSYLMPSDIAANQQLEVIFQFAR